MLAREGWDVVGLDGSPAALAKARGRLNGEHLPASWIAADAMLLPFANASFDAVVDVVAVAHNSFRDCAYIFREVARVLRPGGRLFSMLPRDICSRGPFAGKGPVTFFGLVDLLNAMPAAFRTLRIGWAGYTRGEDRIHHWIVDAVRE
jgi:SAM-dependent methyltransferase